MRVKCPRCGVVFEVPWHPTLVHVGSIKLMKCPSCGKRSMMHTGVKDPVTWPIEPGTEEKMEEILSEDEKLKHRIDESKQERQ